MQSVGRQSALSKGYDLVKGCGYGTGAALAMFLILAGKPADVRANGVDAAVELVAEGLTAPLTLAEFPDDSGRLMVLEQIGRLRVIDVDGNLVKEPFLDFQDRLDPTIEPGFDERGALGFAFHPDYAENGKLYVYYSAPLRENNDLQNEDWGTHTSHIAELEVSSDDPNKADPDYERLVLQVDQPQFAHNAGTLTFGPKGMLHIALGDGGSAPDGGDYPIEGTSQDPGDLLGKILRIDVDQVNGKAYGIPDDNPFVGKEGYRGEIYAMGFRNPYKISFDPDGSGRMFAGDVGQNSYEEIDLVVPGGNYGWAIKEATHCFNWDDIEAHFPSCDDEGLIDPIIEYKNGGKYPDEGQGRSTIGGVIYRGAALPELEGKLVFGDWSLDGGSPAGILYLGSPAEEEGRPWDFERIRIAGGFPHFLLGIAHDQENELYLLAHGAPGPEGKSGRVFRLVPAD